MYRGKRFLSDYEMFGGLVTLREKVYETRRFEEYNATFELPDFTKVAGTVIVYRDGTAIIQSLFDEEGKLSIVKSPVVLFMIQKEQELYDKMAEMVGNHTIEQKRYIRKRRLMLISSLMQTAFTIGLLVSVLFVMKIGIVYAILFAILTFAGIIATRKVYGPQILALNQRYKLQHIPINKYK